MLTEAGAKKRAGVWLLAPEAAEQELAHLGPEALGVGVERLGQILSSDSRRLHSFLRDQRALAGIGRAWANEILQRARLSPFALSTELSPEEVERLSAAIDEELARGLELRERGAKDATVYRIHKRLGEPCPDCGTPIARVDYEEHTIYYCPQCQTGGRVLKTAGSRGCCASRRASGRRRSGRDGERPLHAVGSRRSGSGRCPGPARPSTSPTGPWSSIAPALMPSRSKLH